MGINEMGVLFVEAGEARKPMLRYLARHRRGASCWVSTGQTIRVLYNNSALGMPATWLPWPFSLLQPQDAYYAETPAEDSKTTLESRTFARGELKGAVEYFLRDLDSAVPVQIRD